MIIIPPQDSKKFSQTNSGDFFGNIRKTKNITFVKNGYISLEKRTRLLYDNQTYTSLTQYTTDNIQKIAQAGTKIWVAGTSTMYYLNSALTFTADVTSGTPTINNNTDICEFPIATGERILVVAYGLTSLKYYDGSAWGTIATDLSYPNCLCYFENKASLAVAYANKVQLIDSAKAKSTLLTLPINVSVRSMAWNNLRLYIACAIGYGEDYGDSIIFEWDGNSSEANYAHKVKGGLVYSIQRYKNGVAFVTNNGQLMSLEGSINELANFPIYYKNKQWANDTAGLVQMSGNILSGGMIVDKDIILIGVNATYTRPSPDYTADYFENDFPSGIWCYDPAVGLYHRYSVGGSMRTTTGAITTANVDTSTNIITIPSSICPDTGTPVFYNDGNGGSNTSIAPLIWNTRYYVIKLSGTTLKLATTYANAMAGTAIDLTSTGNNAQTLSFCPVDDFGGSLQYPLALFLMRQNLGLFGFPEKTKADKLLIGSYITKQSTDLATWTGIHTVQHKQENRGYFILPRMSSSNIKETWQKLYIKFLPLRNEFDKILIKYRTVNNNNLYQKIYNSNSYGSLSIAGVWVTPTTFTVDTNYGADITQLVVGYEIEIVNGAGCGYLAHITDISAPTAGVYTITIDESVLNITATSLFQFTVDNWTKLPYSITTSHPDNQYGFAEFSLGIKSPSIEIKVELRGEDVSIEELQIINKTDKPSA